MIRFAIREFLGDRRLQDVADATGIPRGTLARLLSESEPVTNTSYIESLCRYFGIGPEELLVFDPPLARNRKAELEIDVRKLYPQRWNRSPKSRVTQRATEETEK